MVNAGSTDTHNRFAVRIDGPQIAIQAYIAALKEGNYDYQRNLRPHDELNDIMDALKDLRPTLMERDKTLVGSK
jgi:hypothetical protein